MWCEGCKQKNGTLTATTSTVPVRDAYGVWHDVPMCYRCRTIEEIEDNWLFHGNYYDLFPEEDDRERDNIVWQINATVRIYPIYVQQLGDDVVYMVDSTPKFLHTEYFCHDDFLYEVHGVDMKHRLIIGINPYAYRFPKIQHDDRGWIAGFFVNAHNLIAVDVELEDNDNDFESES